MTEAEQTAICKIIQKSCMWGHGGIGSVILDGLQKKFPMKRDWHDVHTKNARKARHEACGVVSNEDEIKRYLDRGYRLTNYRPGELSIFHPRASGGGLYKYITGALADKYGQRYDAWNFRVYQERAKQGELVEEDE